MWKNQNEISNNFDNFHLENPEQILITMQLICVTF